MNNFKANISLVIVSLILGFVISVHSKTINQALGNSNTPLLRSKELAVELESLKNEKSSLENELSTLENKVKQYEGDAAKENVYINELTKELTRYKMYSGYTEVKGPGLVITIDDPDKDAYYGDDSSYIINNYDYILQLISALNITGAEAISINDQRYTSFTEIISIGGNHLNVNGISISTPIVIKVIGNQENLENSLRMKGGVVWNLQYAECKVDIVRSDEVKIPKYNKIKDYKFAMPVSDSVE